MPIFACIIWVELRYIFPVIFAFLIFSGCGNNTENTEVENQDTLSVIEEVNLLFGINADSFNISKGEIQKNQFLADILLDFNVPYPVIHKIAEASKEVFDVRKLARGKSYTIFTSKDTSNEAKIFVYEPNDLDYVVYDFTQDSVVVTKNQKPITLVEKEVEGVIKSSLYQTLQNSDQNVMLTFELADVFAWTIDFYRLQKGDHYKIIYQEQYVEDKVIGISRIHAVLFNHEGKDFYAYYFEQDSTGGDYFDEAAESLRKAFLKSPLKYSRLTSGYTRRRFHPVQKRWKAHLGTDYAAPRGTPILATGDGKVVEARYKKYNGNYVKIRHNSIYMTQYLHMNKIKSGIKAGTYVKQGDVIGYVGSTGLATGPHVCYRFWKHGSQVNHLKEDFPPSEPVREENIQEYYDHIRSLQDRLNEGREDQLMALPQYLQNSASRS